MEEPTKSPKKDKVKEYFAANPKATSVWVDDEGNVYHTHKAKANLKKIERP